MTTIASPPFVLALLGALGCAALAGCRPGAEQPLAIVVSGDTAGWIAPCSCAANQSGGLPRRATYVAGLRRQAAVILADAGGAAGGKAGYDRAKFEAILHGEILMGVAAHNIGAAEALLGPSELRRLARQTGVPLLSANVCDRAGRLVAEPVRVVVAAGRRIALVGVLAERYATAELQVLPPHQAALDALHAAGNYDAAIVLAYLPEDELRQFVDVLPEADAIFGGPTGQPISPRRIGPALLASATNKGKFLVRLDAPESAAAGHWTGRIVELNEQFADDPQQVANIGRFRQQLAEADFAPPQTSFAEQWPLPLPAGLTVAGTAACRKCHEEDDGLWRQSKHAAAWKTLTDSGAHVDPDCQRCHTTGYGLPGGFTSARHSGALVNVGCESCHGPSQRHAAQPAVPTAYLAQAKDRCTVCHDRENSPKFSYASYWKKISHGKSAPPTKRVTPAR